MNINMMAVPALLGSWLLFVVGYWGVRKTDASRARLVWVGGSFLLAIPGLLMVLYYIHLFDHVAAYYEFRSWSGSELSAAGIGLFAGAITGAIKWQRSLAKIVMATLAVGLTSCIIILPHIKPVIAPAKFSEMKDQWDGEICRQSTYHTCGPASTATILRHFGIQATEIELAKECHTYISGTENWYLARAMRRRGLDVSFEFQKPVTTIPVPCIAGIMNAGYGHFITILEDRGDSYLVGDPMLPAQDVPKDLITKRFEFTGFFMPVSLFHVPNASTTLIKGTPVTNTIKKFKIPGDQIKQVVSDLGSGIATDRIVVDGMNVGYMYREKPDNAADSGWRFLAGDESQGYLDIPANLGIFDVNTICSYDKAIIPYLSRPYGTKLKRVGSDSFVDDLGR